MNKKPSLLCVTFKQSITENISCKWKEKKNNFFLHHINFNPHPIIFLNFQNYSYSEFENSK